MNLPSFAWNTARALRWQRRWGLPSALAALLLAGTAWLQVVHLPALHAEARAERDGLTRALRRADATAPRRTPPTAPASDALRFQAAFPAASEGHARLQALLVLAQQHGVALPRTESRAESRPPASGLLARVNITMTGQADYAALRAFIASALAADPALALDGVRLQRSGTDASRVDAELRWSLHGRPDDASVAAPR